MAICPPPSHSERSTEHLKRSVAGLQTPCNDPHMRLIHQVCGMLLALAGSPVHALCSGATVDQEYREADVVVRATVTSSMRLDDDEPTPAVTARWGENPYVELHRLRVTKVFKGRPGPTINLFQEVTSARFPVDLAGDYLIFLNYHRPHAGRGSAARGAMYVRYACGQSKLWREVRPADLSRLRAISQKP